MLNDYLRVLSGAFLKYGDAKERKDVNTADKAYNSFYHEIKCIEMNCCDRQDTAMIDRDKF